MTKDAWFHFLCKWINVERNAKGEKWIVDASDFRTTQSQADGSWIRGGFTFRWTTDHGSSPRVTLICFGASRSVVQRFERLASHSLWRHAVTDPYNLFVIIINDLFLQVDGLVWSLSGVFRTLEAVRTEESHGKRRR
jgi:hypothetical protein